MQFEVFGSRVVAIALGAPADASAASLKIGGAAGGLGTTRRLGEAVQKRPAGATVDVLPSRGRGGGIQAVLAGAIDVAVKWEMSARDRGMARILIIDDDAAVCAMLRQMLAHTGHQVTEAANGAEGIRFFEQDAPDLVITDIFMADKEGIETIIALHRANAELPIIAISGGGRLDSKDYLTAAKKLGARHVLSKPFHRDRLLEVVRECLSENEARKNQYG